MGAASFSTLLYLHFGYLTFPGFFLSFLGLLSLIGAAALAWKGIPGSLSLPHGFLIWLVMATLLAVAPLPWSHFIPQTWPSPWSDVSLALLVFGAGAIVWGAWHESRKLSKLRALAIAMGFIVGAVWTIKCTPDPLVDVWYMHNEAIRNLVHLKDPYDLDFASPYGDLYGIPRLTFYGYPPITLLIQVPFLLLFGDVRYASVAALLLAAWALRRIANNAGVPQFACDAAGALILIQARPFYMVEQAWTEPIVLALLALGILHWRKKNSPATLALGLAAKQFLWPFLIAAWFLPGIKLKEKVRSVLLLAAVTMPFFLWDPERFWYGVVQFHVTGDKTLPISNTIAYATQGHALVWPTWIGFVAWLAIAFACAMLRPMKVGTLLLFAAVAIGLLGFLGSKFYPNYEWLVASLPLLAILAGSSTPNPTNLTPAKSRIVSD